MNERYIDYFVGILKDLDNAADDEADRIIMSAVNYLREQGLSYSQIEGLFSTDNLNEAQSNLAMIVNHKKHEVRMERVRRIINAQKAKGK